MAPRRPVQGKGKQESTEERQLRKWKVLATEYDANQSLSSAAREKFFKDAQELVYNRDDGIRQSVIHTLATPGGLGRIAQLVKDDQVGEVLQSTVTPFLEVIGHSKALASGLLAACINRIYDTLYGQGGICGLKLFQTISEASGFLSLNDLEIALAVLAKLLDMNSGQQAPSIADFKPIVVALSTAVDLAKNHEGGIMLIHARKWIASCEISVSRARPDPTKSVQACFSQLNLANDGPGELSTKGPRHDNDYAAIQKIQILPTFREIFSKRPPYLPALDPSKLHLQGVDGLIDRHFRLYREDSIGSVRDAIRLELDHDKYPLARLRPNETDHGTRTNVYRGLKLQRLKCDRCEGLVITISIDQPCEIRPLYPQQRQDWWVSKNRLQPNSLVCLLDQTGTGQAIFCLVVEIRQRTFGGRDPKGGKGNMSTSLPWRDMGSDPRQAILTISPVDDTIAPVVADYFSGSKSSLKMTLLEFPEILLQSFQPTLAALQAMIGNNKIPFADLIAGESREATVDPPAYSQQREFEFDLSSLMSGNTALALSPTDPLNLGKITEGSTLDEKQAEALVNALTRRLALCQGPPGTGKSFTSVALLRVLLATKAKADLGPILIVTYTNHALDQTLENCLDKGIRNVIRMGTRSKSDRLEVLNVRNVSARMQKTALEKQEGHAQEDALTEATAFVNEEINHLRVTKKRFLYAVKEFWTTKVTSDAARKEIDLRCLLDADIIGMTTSGLARNLSLLKWLPIKVVLVEEAGEVLEAHTLTTLLPSVEHAILIGDHLQLKPSVDRYDLTSESHLGKPYSLDMSMFERLVNPPNDMPGVKLPCTTLQTQRRMRPTISSFIRQTLYPNLQDDSSVQAYPDVAGMKDSVFWLDHSVLEAGAEGTSKSNDFEVRLTVKLVAHLMSQGVYEPKDIAVITPYLGQLVKLRRSLSEVFEIALDDRDKALLEKAGMFELCALNTGKKAEKASLLQALKVATVDNFQGEEAKVVIISLVRSNKQGNCGFLKSPNRINVLLSRAKHGMYVIGNSKTSSGVPMWAKVLQIFREQGNIGTKFRLRCSKHPHAVMEASKAEDFTRLSPEGGCTLACNTPLRCGHPCGQICHSRLRHDSVFCRESCARKKVGCKHACQNLCGAPCDARCEELLKGITLALPCGHIRADLRCWESQNLAAVQCTLLVSKRSFKCGHTIQVNCHEDVGEDFYGCHALCGGKLECGHYCKTVCYGCPDWDGVRMHAPCEMCD